jgi:N5-(cytidine 5'-diphosphoramidyl)-L-glutamine hydrolase
MKRLLVSQRVTLADRYGERRDCLDQRWTAFLAQAGFFCTALPNRAETAAAFADAIAPVGVLLTGGGDLAVLGGDAPERDATETAVLAWAQTRDVPVFGVCRGFQFLLHRHGSALARIDGHVGTRHVLSDGTQANSFHDWAAHQAPPGWRDIVTADDGTIEAATSADGRIAGQMWHPEREAPFAPRDIDRIRTFFKDAL